MDNTWVLMSPATSRYQFLFDYYDLAVRDHGIVRLIYPNRHKVAKGLWRAGQPWPHDIRRYARKGIRTIINLRGGQRRGRYWLEREACHAEGLSMIDFDMKARRAPSVQTVLDLADLFKQIEFPAVMHCKSGCDRSGFAAALYEHLELGVPLKKALDHLDIRYGHLKSRRAGILDHFFREYQVFNAEQPMPLLDWVRDHYDPAALEQSFKNVTLRDVISYYYGARGYGVTPRKT